MARYDNCPTPECSNKKLSNASVCGECYQRERTKGSDADRQCDGSGLMTDLCETLVIHVHCPCGEPMTSPAELARNYCETYCLPERKGDLRHAPSAETHGEHRVSHIVAEHNDSPFRAQQMVFNHGTEMLHWAVENSLRWNALKRDKREGSVTDE